MSVYYPGDYVKAEVRDSATGEREWMWVLVDYPGDERRLLFGRLDNEPIIQTDMRLGMELAVSYDNFPRPPDCTLVQAVRRQTRCFSGGLDTKHHGVYDLSVNEKANAKPFDRGSVSEEISLISVNHKMDEDDIIRVIEKATGLTVPDSGDPLESLTDDQVVAVWKHMMQWDEGQCALCRSIIPAGDPRVFAAQDEIFCSEACANEAEENR